MNYVALWEMGEEIWMGIDKVPEALFILNYPDPFVRRRCRRRRGQLSCFSAPIKGLHQEASDLVHCVICLVQTTHKTPCLG